MCSLKLLFKREKFERMRLYPLKVLLYLESRERGERAPSFNKLAKEMGIGSDGTVADCFLWLLNKKYIAPAPGIGGVNPTEIKDPNEFIVTVLGKEALTPYLNTFSLDEVMSVIALSMLLGFTLGLVQVLLQLYPSYIWYFAILDLVAVAVTAGIVAIVLRAGRRRYKERILTLMESVFDRG